MALVFVSRGTVRGAREDDWCADLERGAHELGLNVDDQVLAKAWQYYRLLDKWGRKTDLTNITDPIEVADKMFLDSWLLSPHIPEGARVLDAGSGAGFPGLALKILRKDIILTSSDSKQKKCVFQRRVVDELKLDRVIVSSRRVEALGIMQLPDVVIARALASLKELVSLVAGYVVQGAHLIALKGPGVDAEISQAESALLDRGFIVSKVESCELPLTKSQRRLVWVERKVGKRPDRQ